MKSFLGQVDEERESSTLCGDEYNDSLFHKQFSRWDLKSKGGCLISGGSFSNA